MKTDSSELESLVLSPVVDFLITGTHQIRNSFFSPLKRTFTIVSESRLPLMFTGLAIKKEADGTISVSQEKFVENLIQIDFKPSTHDVLSEREVEAFRSLVGKLQWPSSHTTPDLSFSGDTFINGDGMRVDRASFANKLIHRVIYEKDCLSGHSSSQKSRNYDFLTCIFSPMLRFKISQVLVLRQVMSLDFSELLLRLFI